MYDPATFRDLAAKRIVTRTAYRQCGTCRNFFFVKVLARHAAACRKAARAEAQAADAAFKAKLATGVRP